MKVQRIWLSVLQTLQQSSSFGHVTLRYIDILSNFPYLPLTDDLPPRFWLVMRDESASMAISYEDERGSSSEHSMVLFMFSMVWYDIFAYLKPEN